MIANIIKFSLSNFTLTFFLIGLICSCVSLIAKPKPISKKVLLESLFSYFLLFSVGIMYIYNFVFHVFFQEMAAEFIGWANSPFQAEVGFASLGFGIVGIIAFRASFGFRAAAVTAPAFFLWGAAGGHIVQMVKTHNFSPGNAGIIFWTDIFFPIIGFIFLYFQYSCSCSKEMNKSV
jgi:uncharacterized protein DUF6790